MDQLKQYPRGECASCLPCCDHCQYFVPFSSIDPATDDFVDIDPIIATVDYEGTGWCVVHQKGEDASLGCANFLCGLLPRVLEAAPALNDAEALHVIALAAQARYPVRIPEA